ncbi:hypothetical protein SKAU_G00236470 [Synaphobranchus kaupii]|uniref:Uncharacterized protein n=1 Tax=Synaphobranchus kaupii TaxID=118154 RepID=A0A9Q1F6Q0_SYNKA|nr:hypothetical protein SKAU_G00236470 [Synaphobranchus kaupii]
MRSPLKGNSVDSNVKAWGECERVYAAHWLVPTRKHRYAGVLATLRTGCKRHLAPLESSEGERNSCEKVELDGAQREWSTDTFLCAALLHPTPPCRHIQGSSRRGLRAASKPPTRLHPRAPLQAQARQ